MIDIPGIYVGRFKDDPNQSTMLMNEATKCYGFRNIADFDEWIKSGRKL